MAVDNSNVVDFIGIDEKNNEVILTISDHLDWNTIHHIEILQSKINAYINFIESGEIYEVKKDAQGKKIIIEVIGKHNLPIEAINFYDQVNTILSDLDLKLRFKNLSTK